MMNLPEEEADKELSRKLQQRFEGFKAPVNDQVRKNVFAALGDSSRMIYWIPRAGGMLLLVVFIIGYILFDRKPDHEVVLGSKKSAASKLARTNAKTAHASGKSVIHSGSKQDIPVQESKTTLRLKTQKENSSAFSEKMDYAKPRAGVRETVVLNDKSREFDFGEDGNLHRETKNMMSINEKEGPFNLAFLSSIDSIYWNNSFANLTIPSVSSSSGETRKKSRILHGVKGVFSASVLQNFQLVNLSQSTAEHIQNFRFAPLFSSKSLSYKVTAGLEKKHLRILLNYTYLRNWNEYEIGTNQVVATNVGGHQYQMLRIGERHVEDDRSHLLGIGIQQKIRMPQQILKGYSLNVGAEYTLVVPGRGSLFWGNVGFYRQIYQSAGIQLEIGPYGEYSFMQREVTGQTWKYRPYQVGISLHVKMK